MRLFEKNGFERKILFLRISPNSYFSSKREREEGIMNAEKKVLKHKLSVLELAAALGGLSAVYHQRGVPRNLLMDRSSTRYQRDALKCAFRRMFRDEGPRTLLSLHAVQ